MAASGGVKTHLFEGRNITPEVVKKGKEKPKSHQMRLLLSAAAKPLKECEFRGNHSGRGLYLFVPELVRQNSLRQS
ncbi:hypothetical protein [Silvimonas sp.]|uniref:hypothetical protein n=1 Tax=Silvimonas sp. TaxID=2650811 RepID=UPI0028491871|nr:hypothetical protein [Silvimonas sp.]MDR3429580.1 hypothetical protein [Silvimonas sp.]